MGIFYLVSFSTLLSIQSKSTNIEFYTSDFAKASFTVNTYVLMLTLWLFSSELISGVKRYAWMKSKDTMVTAEKKR